MIGIERAVVWWDEWQLRILVLGSLGMQWFLVLVAPMRKYTVARWFRTCIWLAYISSDAVAIYALATLFNRHARGSSECQYGGKASSLEVLWAPLLLVHLGGREEITAYNIEDNELWTRHTVTLVSQVTVAVYAFYKSWPNDGNGRLLLSAILLFINGIINFCEKPWALRSASINRLVAVSSIIKGERRSPSWWECCFSELDDRYKCWKDWAEKKPKPILSEMDRVQMILSDLSLLAVKLELAKQADGDEQEDNNNIFLKLDPSAKKEDQMRRWLRKAFELIYTRANVISAPAYLACNMFLVPALYVAAITLFSVSRKQAYSVTDVKITYILMCFTAVLDVFGVIIGMMVYRLMIHARFPALCETLPEYNLINLVLRRMKPSTGWLLKCCTSVGYKEDYFQVGHDNLYSKVSDFVVTQLMSSQKVDGLDLGSYRSLLDKENNNNWALDEKLRDYLLGEHHNEKTKTIQHSLRDLPFDESVLVWHIATDLFFSMKPPYGFHCRPPHDEVLRELCTQAISNYMVHLLNFCPEMLMTGSRKHLFTKATSNLEQLLQDDQTKNQLLNADSKERVAKIIIEKTANKHIKEEDKKYSLIHKACKLAQELMALPEDDDRLWELMYRVWVGMLCYSASMCRGYLHAKNLGEGGEFLSYVWLVISLKGAKTLADKLQMSEEANKKPPTNEQPQDEATTSTSEQAGTTKQSEKDIRSFPFPNMERRGGATSMWHH
ncbi:hypothetical protein PR202_gb13758 [Eleusine coracana subsp. coracana]|uniref:DUF4220 domain-containing protein n=1 Tax=Eleusine coracana subsp. coracana TaxID=191504 RepID=A0AAV5ETN1_ELECO|nr:hypothetical protein QOZ80_9BG0718930 [Eleusine coracana subsp. coracana]GJN25872.1 hypothetical protein PR202_gb13758 [Eleusine coracana subsp. coracana]